MTLIGEAFVRIRPDTTGFRQDTARQVRRELTAAERQAGGTNQQLREMERRFTGLRTAAPAIGAGIAGAIGLFTVGLGKSVAAAKDAEAVQAQLTNALRAQGISFEQNRQQIEARVQAISQMSGFDDELVATTFTNLVRRTNDVTKALNLSALAADVARGRNISLEAAQQLVIKASLGMAGQLRRLGIAADKNATSVQLLDLLQRKYAGSAKTYGETASGAQERFNVALENAQEIIGRGVLPSLTKVLERATKFLENQKTQERIQRGVEQGANATATAFDLVGSAIGGVEQASHFLRGRDPFGYVSGIKLGIQFIDVNKRLGNSFADEAAKVKAAAEAIESGQQRIAKGYSAIEAARQGAITGRSVAGLIPGKVGGASFVGRPLTAEEQLDLALAGDPDNPRLLGQRRSLLQRRLDFALKQLKDERGNTKSFVDQARRLRTEITGITEHLAQIAAEQAQRLRDAARRRREAEERRRQAFLDLVGEPHGGTASVPGSFERAQALFAAGIPGRVRGNATVDLQAARQALLQVPETLRLQTEIAEQRFTNEEKLIPFYQREIAALDKRERQLKRLKATEAEILQVELDRATLQRRIRDIKKDQATTQGFTLTEFFQEVARERDLYGSNIGAGPLSGQDARASLNTGTRLPMLAGATIVQNFYGERSAGQAITTASQAARALR